MTEADLQTLPLTVALQQAISHHQAKRLTEAEELYRAILQARPGHPDANHNLGVLIMQMQQAMIALPYFKAALEANPKQGQYWLSYIEALIESGQTDIARQILVQGRQRGLQGEVAAVLAKQLEQAGATALTPIAAPTAEETAHLISLFTQGCHEECEVQARMLTARFPRHGFGWKVLGACLREQGKLDNAFVALQTAVALWPADAEVHSNLGVILRDQDRLSEAEISYRQAVELNPDFAEAHNNLGNVLKGQGRLTEAEASYRRALELKPAYAGAHNNLGNVLKDQGCFAEAEASYHRALELQPDVPEVLNNLALLLKIQGKPMMALEIVGQSLSIKETDETKKVFVECLKGMRGRQCPGFVREALVRALSEPWDRPSLLAQVGIDIVKQETAIGECLARVAAAWPQRLEAPELFGAVGIAPVAGNALLCALLDSVTICDIDLERFLTMVRRVMLNGFAVGIASPVEESATLDLYGVLARQCFLNEYVFAWTDDEADQARTLRDSLVAALKAEAAIHFFLPLVVAAYFPLHSLPLAERMLDQSWPEAVKAVLVQQVREPAEERRYRATMPQLTSVENEVSLLVQRQYEENPYPRWNKAASASKPTTIDRYFFRHFPFAPFQSSGRGADLDILIAGCGTGQQPIETAQRFRGAELLAVDLSLSSLCYAKRKTRELGLTMIEYAQADILRLEYLGRSFDIIESCGVLHHLDDPMKGWRVLLSLLRPGGVMKLGFYSEIARRDIVRARAFIAEQGYGSTVEEIRRCRQDVMHFGERMGLETVISFLDFFSISECRDLLFHVQEHRLTLVEIEAFIQANNLFFLGFQLEGNILDAYRRRFPDDRAATNLDYWQAFECEHPDTFRSMYQFWIQKAW